MKWNKTSAAGSTDHRTPLGVPSFDVLVMVVR